MAKKKKELWLARNPGTAIVRIYEEEPDWLLCTYTDFPRHTHHCAKVFKRWTGLSIPPGTKRKLGPIKVKFAGPLIKH